MAFVYLLACADRSLYCGWTTDLDARLATHSAGRGAAYTRARLPVRYAAAWECETARDARSLEAKIKRLPRAAKVALVEGRAEPAGAVVGRVGVAAAPSPTRAISPAAAPSR